MSFHGAMSAATRVNFDRLGEPARYEPAGGPVIDTRAIYQQGVQIIDEYQRIVTTRDELKLMCEVIPDAAGGDLVTLNHGTPGAHVLRLDSRLARNRYQDHWAVLNG